MIDKFESTLRRKMSGHGQMREVATICKDKIYEKMMVLPETSQLGQVAIKHFR